MTVYRAVCRINIPDQAAGGVNVWHFRGSGAASEGEVVSSIAGDLKDFYTAAHGMYPNDVSITAPEYLVTVEAEPKFVAVSQDDQWTVQGYGGSGRAPEVLQIVCDWITDSPSRSGRGRTFIGPLGSTSVGGDGLPVPSQVANLRTAAEALVAKNNLDLHPSNLVVYSTTHSISRDVVRTSTRGRFAVLRSRRD